MTLPVPVDRLIWVALTSHYAKFTPGQLFPVRIQQYDLICGVSLLPESSLLLSIKEATLMMLQKNEKPRTNDACILILGASVIIHHQLCGWESSETFFSCFIWRFPNFSVLKQNEHCESKEKRT